MSLDPRHTAYVGWVLGIARRNVPTIRAIVDDDGHLTAGLLIELPEAAFMVIVPPPPETWRLDRDDPGVPDPGHPCGTCGTVLDSARQLADHLESHARIVERGGSLDDLPGTGTTARRAATGSRGGTGTPPGGSALKRASRGVS